MRYKLAIALALVAAAAVGGRTVYAQPADNCLRMQVNAVGATMMWNRQSEAEQSAITAWTSKATTQAGAAYSQWDKARAKSVKCDVVSKSTVRCTAKGTPCK